MAVDDNNMPNIIGNADDLGDLSMKISKWVHPKPSERIHMGYIALTLTRSWYIWRDIWFIFDQKSFTCYQNSLLSYKNSIWKFFPHIFYSARHFLHFNFPNQNQFNFYKIYIFITKFTKPCNLARIVSRDLLHRSILFIADLSYLKHLGLFL